MKYSIQTTSIEATANTWKHTFCEIFDETGNKVFQYKRNYGGHSEKTFATFHINGQDYALFSRHYEDVEVVKLPSGDILDTKVRGVCPVEIMVPRYGRCDYICNGESKSFCSSVKEPNDGSLNLQNIKPFPFALMLGCYWGDDSSWKLCLIDLREIEQGKISYWRTKDNHIYYEDTHEGTELKDITIETEDDGEGNILCLQIMYPARGDIIIKP